jgi:predicted ABC-type ATPase
MPELYKNSALLPSPLTADEILRLRALFIPKNTENKIPPTLYAMAGIPGSGKSTYVDHAQHQGLFPKNIALIDPDRVMQAIPAYHDDVAKIGAEAAFTKWEMPVRQLTYDFYDDSAAQNLTIIQDMGSARPEFLERFSRLKQQGYLVHITYIFCPLDIALKRMATRPRFTPESLVRERHDSLAKLLPLYHDLADQFTVLDNSRDDARYIPISSATIGL